MNVQTTLVIF